MDDELISRISRGISTYQDAMAVARMQHRLLWLEWGMQHIASMKKKHAARLSKDVARLALQMSEPWPTDERL